MTQISHSPQATAQMLTTHEAWLALKASASEFQTLQSKDGSLAEAAMQPRAGELIGTIVEAIDDLLPHFAHDANYLQALVADLKKWEASGFGAPDFLDALLEFQPQTQREDGLLHLVLFPMYTQNGSTNRHLEAVLVQVMWPDFIAQLEEGSYSNALFVPLRFIDFTAGYDTNSAVLFPESVAIRETPSFTWGAIFQDREAARFRKVLKEAAAITNLQLPADAAQLLTDQQLTEETFIMWDLIHDRTHMRGDLPFDPFMIKQRMPFFLYSLEELRCDLTAFRESMKIAADPASDPKAAQTAKLVQYAVIFDRIFRFAITGSRVRNYDGLGGQLLFAWMHQHHVLHWTDTKLSIDWDQVPEVVAALGDAIDDLYWKSIDRPKLAHWLAAYELVSATVTPNPASAWAKGPEALPLNAPLREITDQVLDDEFPLSMFYEALNKKMAAVIESTRGMTGATSI
ncbi:DUF6421 family protein [Glutamicibacter sp. 287]|uniref:DUF6421 family protein n=1 Tax=unclassified Glutamicibacter TaxID=2627139 RepID=UPI000BB6F573|nr:DUF6421 family protein [Glutamicibacter sp. BW80]PCC28506.1 hypothetical protein CIK76_10945 [Glutamicibacter sp. BW80]